MLVRLKAFSKVGTLSKKVITHLENILQVPKEGMSVSSSAARPLTVTVVPDDTPYTPHATPRAIEPVVAKVKAMAQTIETKIKQVTTFKALAEILETQPPEVQEEASRLFAAENPSQWPPVTEHARQQAEERRLRELGPTKSAVVGLLPKIAPGIEVKAPPPGSIRPRGPPPPGESLGKAPPAKIPKPAPPQL